MAAVTLGPVIGEVTTDTARILVECDRDVDVTCVASDSSGHVVRVPATCTKNRPTVFKLAGLQAETTYAVTFEGADCPVVGAFTTYPPTIVGMNVAAVSCNFTIHRQETDLWGQLRDHYIIPRLLDLLLHVGDQIYGDDAFQEAIHLLNGRTRGTKRQEEQILELYRTRYRWSWGFPATRAVMAGVPNLTIWDDHEIRDDWGSLATDRIPETAEYYVGTLARRVYREYQRALWEDVDPDVDPAPDAPEDHLHVWDRFGVLFVDQRGARSFGYDPRRPYLGTAQWNRITGALARGGSLDQVQALLVITSVPLAYLGGGVTTIGQELMNDLLDHWAYAPHQKEQLEFLRALREWKAAGNGLRELLVIGGDVHVGCRTEVRHFDQPIFQQLITSPITNKPPSWAEFQGLSALLEPEHRLGESYAFRHSGLTRQRNFGMVIVRVPVDTGAPRIDPSLVIAV